MATILDAVRRAALTAADGSIHHAAVFVLPRPVGGQTPAAEPAPRHPVVELVAERVARFTEDAHALERSAARHQEQAAHDLAAANDLLAAGQALLASLAAMGRQL